MINRWHQSTTAIALCVSSAVAAQSAEERKEISKSTNAEELTRMSAALQAKFERDEARVLVYLSKHPDQRRSFEKNGSTYYLARIDDADNPVYINAKTKNTCDPKLRVPTGTVTADFLHGGGSR